MVFCNCLLIFLIPEIFPPNPEYVSGPFLPEKRHFMVNFAKKLTEEFEGSEDPTMILNEGENQDSGPGITIGGDSVGQASAEDFGDFPFAQGELPVEEEGKDENDGGGFASFDLGQFVDSEHSQDFENNLTVSAGPDETVSVMNDFNATDATSAADFSSGMQTTDLSAIVGDEQRPAFATTQEALSDQSVSQSEREFAPPYLESSEVLADLPSHGITALGVEQSPPEAFEPDAKAEEQSQAIEDAPASMGFLDPDPVEELGNVGGGNFPPEHSFVGTPHTFQPAVAPVVKPPGRFAASGFGSVLYRFRAAGTALAMAAFVVGATILAAPMVVSEDNLRGFAVEHQLEDLFVSLGMLSKGEGSAPGVTGSHVSGPVGFGAGTAGPQTGVAPAPGQPGAGEQSVVAEQPKAAKPFEANRDYFSQIADAMQQGDPEKAAQLMKQRPPKPLEGTFDLDASAMAAARFYLFVGRSSEALRVMEERCAKRSTESMSAEHCIPLARAYLSMGRIDNATKIFAQVAAAPDASEQAEPLQMLKAAVSSAQRLSPRGVADHLLVFLKQSSTSVEWERQQSFWIVESLARLGHKRWPDFAKIVFSSEREKFSQALASVTLEGGRFRNALAMTRLLDYLAVRFGYQVLGFQHGIRSYGLNDHRLSVTLHALSANMIADGGDLTVVLQGLRDKKPFGEVERLIKLNLAVQENRWTKAYQILSAQIPTLKESRFGFEWKLAGALFAIGSNNIPMSKSMFEGLKLYGTRNPLVTSSFDYWHILAKLGQFAGIPVNSEIDRAESFASSERERGLIAALRLNAASGGGKNREMDIESYVNRFPWHDSVLTAAILASGRAGKDPTRYMRMQDRITVARLAAGREKNLLLDSTVEELLRIL